MKMLDLGVDDFLIGDIVILLKGDAYLIEDVNICNCNCHKGRNNSRVISVDVIFIKSRLKQVFRREDYEEFSTRKVYRF